jgi:FkbM family methyltransferase
MINNLKNIVKKHNLQIRGVIHVGAYSGAEYHIYKKLHIRNMIFFEPCSFNFEKLTQLLGNKTKISLFRKVIGKLLQRNFEKEIILVKKAIGNENKKILMNVETANGGSSNSILDPLLHLEQYPDIKFEQKEEVEMIKLDDALGERKKDYNFLAIDVQGYELEVLKGGTETLKNIDCIISEVNNKENYVNCVLIEDLDKFLLQNGFIRSDVNWNGGTWGDALYLKKTNTDS